jgi:hypothetical protein
MIFIVWCKYIAFFHILAKNIKDMQAVTYLDYSNPATGSSGYIAFCVARLASNALTGAVTTAIQNVVNAINTERNAVITQFSLGSTGTAPTITAGAADDKARLAYGALMLQMAIEGCVRVPNSVDKDFYSALPPNADVAFDPPTTFAGYAHNTTPCVYTTAFRTNRAATIAAAYALQTAIAALP